MPKAMEYRVPLASYWAAIKASNPALTKSPLFKPDINVPIKSYDLGINNYTKLMLDRDKLKDLLTTFIKYSDDMANKIAQHRAELDKIMDKDNAEVAKIGNDLKAAAAKDDADPAQVTATLVDLCTGAEDLVSSRKQVWDQISKLGEAKVQATKKLRDDYKAKATAIANGMKKIEDDSIKLEGQIRANIAAYQKIALQMDHDDLVDAVRGLLDHF